MRGGLLLYGGVVEALRGVGFDFFLTTESDGILDPLDEAEDIPNVVIGAYLDNIFLALSLVEFRVDLAPIVNIVARVDVVCLVCSIVIAGQRVFLRV